MSDLATPRLHWLIRLGQPTNKRGSVEARHFITGRFGFEIAAVYTSTTCYFYGHEKKRPNKNKMIKEKTTARNSPFSLGASRLYQQRAHETAGLLQHRTPCRRFRLHSDTANHSLTLPMKAGPHRSYNTTPVTNPRRYAVSAYQ